MSWEAGFRIPPPRHLMILVSGRSVVSVLKSLPSTVPERMADGRLLIGNSGFVILVGSENGGAVRSTRSLRDATGMSRFAAASCAWVGCGILVASWEEGDRSSPLHAAIPSAAA